MTLLLYCQGTLLLIILLEALLEWTHFERVGSKMILPFVQMELLVGKLLVGTLLVGTLLEGIFSEEGFWGSLALLGEERKEALE